MIYKGFAFVESSKDQPSYLSNNMHALSIALISLSLFFTVQAVPNPGAVTRACEPPPVNPATVAMVKDLEGFVDKPAPDPIGLPTVGYGHLCKSKGCSEVPFPFPLTQDTAAKLLQLDFKPATKCISNDINSSIKLNDNQYGALASWAFNVGCGNVKTSTLVKRLNAGENPNTVAAQELPQWNKANGKVLPGLVKRRAREVKLFQTPSGTIAHPAC